MARGFDLSAYGLHAPEVFYNPSLGLLYEDGVVCEGDWITATGALATNSGDRTRLAPRDRRIVESLGIESHVEWNDYTQRLSEKSYALLRKAAVEYLDTCGRLYVVDGYYGADPNLRLKVRVICARAYHAMFMRTMLLPVTDRTEFATADVLILNAGQTPADPKTPGLSSGVSVGIHLASGEIVILGTDYAAEMKAALFTVASYRFAQHGVLALRAAAIDAAEDGLTLLIGLPGTGKSALAFGSGHGLIADDAVAWTDQGVFPLEAGCYPRCQGLSSVEQPELAVAIRFGALLENVVVAPRTRVADFQDSTLTDNIRAVFPLIHLRGTNPTAAPRQPRNVILLTCDATGVLPPVSRLTAEQAANYYLSGYSSKSASKAPSEAVFSPCYGAGLLVRPPADYVELFAARVRAQSPQLWLVNTGWVGGPVGLGRRITLAESQAIVRAISSGELDAVPFEEDPRFGLEIPRHVPNLREAILRPRDTWPEPAEYEVAAAALAAQFEENARRLATDESFRETLSLGRDVPTVQ
jgi:phosphoenolpyruvate carboxykinase (ATP)